MKTMKNAILVFACLLTALHGFSQNAAVPVSSADSLAAARQVDSLLRVSRERSARKDFDSAFELNAAAQKIALEKMGRLSEKYGYCCLYRADLYNLKKENKDAETWYQEALAIQEKVLGKEHPLYAKILNNLASVYFNWGKNEKAETVLLEIIALRGKVLGKEHPDYVRSLMVLANVYQKMNKLEKAEALYLEAKTVQHKVLGKEHPEYAKILANLAAIYVEKGNYDKAEPLYVEAKAIREKVLGRDHPDYASTLNSLANLYLYMGKYEKAEPLYVEAKGIRGKVLGKEHPDYTITTNNLANLYLNMGAYEKAEPLYLEAKATWEKVQGKEHPEYAGYLQNLGELYRDMGNYEKAASLLSEANAILEKLVGKEHPNFALNLQNLANLYSDMGDNIKAERYYLETKTIQEKVLGKEHPDYAGSLQNLGNIYYEMGEYKKAERYYLDAKTIQEKVLGKEHPDYAGNLQSLGNLYSDMGDNKKAELLYLEAEAVFEKVLGKGHSIYATSLNNLASLYEKQHRFSESNPLLATFFSLQQERLTKSVHYLSERELAQYNATFGDYGDVLASYLLVRTLLPEHPPLGALPALAYNHALFQKGFLLNDAARLNTLAASTTESQEINLRLKGFRRLLAAEYAKPVAEQKNTAELEEKANLAEKELARSISGYGQAMRQVKWEAVMSTLKKDEASIEFVAFQVKMPKNTDSVMYAALLLKQGNIQPQFIPLFEEKSLDSLLHSKSARKSDYVNNLYTLADRGVAVVEAPKRSLYEMLWQPLEKELSGVKTICFSPGGLLYRINLDAIPVSETETLADRYHLTALKSTRQLVVPDQVKLANNDAVLFGGIQFEPDSTVHHKDTLQASPSRGELSFSSTDSTLRGGTWNYLAGTDREVNSIEKIMQTAGVKSTLYKRYLASEEAFKKIGANNAPSPRILHIATHGYFYPDSKNTEGTARINNAREPVFKMSDHPMLRSGLIMAGGNATWQGTKPSEGQEDGILTAYEISQMNLSNTELVVLSACETGLGDIEGNEGVYGLQRAFKIAGAKYLIMSLWQVPDKQTSLLMTSFYKNWLEEKMTLPEAFHAAQKQLRDNGLDPYNWAGFVLVE